MTISKHQTSFTNGNVAPLMTHFVNFWFWPMAVDDDDPGRMNFCPFQNTSKIFKVYSCVPYLKHAWRIDPRPASNRPKKRPVRIGSIVEQTYRETLSYTLPTFVIRDLDFSTVPRSASRHNLIQNSRWNFITIWNLSHFQLYCTQHNNSWFSAAFFS